MSGWALLASAGLAFAAALSWRCFPDAVRPLLIGLNRRSAGLRLARLTVAEHRLCLLVRDPSGPAGREALPVLLHGIFAKKDHWVDFARALPRDAHLVIPDLPGFGHSDRRNNTPYGDSEQVARLAARLDALGIQRAHLAGCSMGGTLAALFALAHPHRVASLAFIGAPHGLRSSIPSPSDRLIDTGQAPLIASDAAAFEALLGLLFHRRPWIPDPVLHGARRDAQRWAAFNRPGVARPPGRPIPPERGPAASCAATAGVVGALGPRLRRLRRRRRYAPAAARGRPGAGRSGPPSHDGSAPRHRPDVRPVPGETRCGMNAPLLPWLPHSTDDHARERCAGSRGARRGRRIAACRASIPARRGLFEE